jgi:solute carrier family 25 S-adenosylmethionine transporter 26
MVSSTASSTNATLQTLAKFRSNPFALWRGYTALAGRNLPFTALQFPMFERLKEKIRMYRDEKGLTRGTIWESGIITAISAGSAGTVAAVVTTPVDVVKTRIMLAAADDAVKEASASQKAAKSGSGGLVDALGKSVDASKEGAKGAVQSLNPMKSEKGGRKTSWQIGKEIVNEKGLKGLMRGGALRGVWTFIGSGLYLGVYESGRVYLAGRRGEHVDEADLF